jgi:hypothetical protein
MAFLTRRFPGVLRVHARSLAAQFLLQIGANETSRMRRAAPPVSLLMCPFCVRTAVPNKATCIRSQVGRIHQCDRCLCTVGGA